MGLLKDRDWPDVLSAALQRILERIPHKRLAGEAYVFPGPQVGGFRKKDAKPEVVRRIAMQHLCGRGEVSGRVRRLVMKHSLHSRVVVGLSEELLLRNRQDLQLLFDPHELILAMCLDEREKVREAGLAELALLSEAPPVPPAEPAPEVLREIVTRLFSGFLEEIEPVIARIAAEETPVPESKPQLTPQQQNELHELRQQAAHARQFEKKIARLENDLSQQQNEIRRQRELSAELQQQVADQTATASRLAGVLEEFRRHRTEDLAQALHEHLRQARHAWLRDAQADAVVLEQVQHNDLAGQARALLARQQQLDRRAGTRSALRRSLTELTSLRGELLQAQADALQPLPELTPLIGDLDDEIKRLSAAAGESDATAGQLRLAARLASVAADERKALEEACRVLTSHGLLGPTECALLHEARRDDFARQLAEHAAATEPQQTPFERLWQRLVGDSAPATIYLDGHNLLLNPTLNYWQGGEVTEQTRRALITDVGRLFQQLPADYEVRLYFDGPEPSEETLAPGFVVIFSGGSGDNRADDRIVSLLQFRKKDKRPVILLTDDRELRLRARKACGGLLALSAYEFGLLCEA